MTLAQHLDRPAFMVICDGACDQICGSQAEAAREMKDLKKMGFEKVYVKAFATWAAAHATIDFINGNRERWVTAVKLDIADEPEAVVGSGRTVFINGSE